MKATAHHHNHPCRIVLHVACETRSRSMPNICLRKLRGFVFRNRQQRRTQILTSVVVDGNASMTMQYPCPDSVITSFNNAKQYIQHYPSVQNQIGSVGGWTGGAIVLRGML